MNLDGDDDYDDDDGDDGNDYDGDDGNDYDGDDCNHYDGGDTDVSILFPVNIWYIVIVTTNSQSTN